MKYASIHKAIFKSRPNRFIAVCVLEGQEVICHVKNTGRCRELLIDGCTVYLDKCNSPTRKTGYDLVAVEKGCRLINIDSQAPNKVFGEFLAAGAFRQDLTAICPEKTYGESRFDFYVEYGIHKAFIEVKGVTLEEKGRFLFPDAPTERGIKHLEGLCTAIKKGYDAYMVFIIQAQEALSFSPNRLTHPAFAAALVSARQKGVRLLYYTCRVTPDMLAVDRPVPILL